MTKCRILAQKQDLTLLIGTVKHQTKLYICREIFTARQVCVKKSLPPRPKPFGFCTRSADSAFQLRRTEAVYQLSLQRDLEGAAQRSGARLIHLVEIIVTSRLIARKEARRIRARLRSARACSNSNQI